MSTRLYRDGFQFERFYAKNLGEFSDDIGAMLHFALPDHSSGLEHHDCKDQLLDGVDGKFIRLFGGLEHVKGHLDQEGYEQLSMDICRAFYLLKLEDYDGFARTINGMDEVLGASRRRKKTANDDA